MCKFSNPFSSPAISPAIAAAVSMAAILVAKNNPVLAAEVLPVAEGIQSQIDKGGDNIALNTLFQASIKNLLAEIKDPAVQLAVTEALAMIQFNPTLPTVPVLSNPTIQAMVDSFVNGLKMAVAPAS
jgi:hypothetical protein